MLVCVTLNILLLVHGRHQSQAQLTIMAKSVDFKAIMKASLTNQFNKTVDDPVCISVFSKHPLFSPLPLSPLWTVGTAIHLRIHVSYIHQ